MWGCSNCCIISKIFIVDLRNLPLSDETTLRRISFNFSLIICRLIIIRFRTSFFEELLGRSEIRVNLARLHGNGDGLAVSSFVRAFVDVTELTLSYNFT